MMNKVLIGLLLFMAFPAGASNARAIEYCAMIGDSIADGLLPYFPQCTDHARSGAISRQIVTQAQDAFTAVVSAGTNDTDWLRLPSNLAKIRNRLTHKVIWIVPQPQPARIAVEAIAFMYGDRLVYFTPGPDGSHPESYAVLAADIGPI